MGLDLMSLVGPVANAVGSVGNVIGAFGQKKEAKRQLKEGNAFANQQRLDYNQTYADLLGMAQGQASYKGDVSQYTRAEDEARRQQQIASTLSPADQLYREQASKTSANTFARGTKGARSGADIMSLAGLVNANENQQMQGINIDTANRGQSLQQQANQNVISTIAQTAAAKARERGLEFESLLNKQQNIQGLTREQGLGSMDLAYRQKQEQFARQGAVQDARSAIYSGFGDIFKSIGGGISQTNMQNQQMDILRGMYPQQVAASPVQDLWAPNFRASNGYDLFNLAKTTPTGWGASGVPK